MFESGSLLPLVILYDMLLLLIISSDYSSCFLQKDDLRAVVNYLRTDGNVSCIGLWGRSMGAVTRSYLWISTLILLYLGPWVFDMLLYLIVVMS